MMYRYTFRQFNDLTKSQFFRRGIAAEHQAMIPALPMAALNVIRSAPGKQLSVFVDCGTDTLGGKIRKIYVASCRRFRGEAGGALSIDPGGIEATIYDRTANRSRGYRFGAAMKPVTTRARRGHGWVHAKIYGGAGAGQPGAPLNHVAQAAAPAMSQPLQDDDDGAGAVFF